MQGSWPVTLAHVVIHSQWFSLTMHVSSTKAAFFLVNEARGCMA